MAEYYGNEVKTGLVILICIILLVFLIVSVGDFQFKKPYQISVLFSSVSKLESDAPVTYAGNEIGKIENIIILSPAERQKYSNKYNCEVTLKIHNGVRIEYDAVAKIETMGFLGSKYINFSPGTKDAGYMKPDNIVMGVESVEIGSLMVDVKEKLDVLGSSIEQLLASSNKLVDDADILLVENREDIRSSIQDIRLSAQNIKGITGKINNEIGDILDNTKTFTSKIAEKPNAIVWGYKGGKEPSSADESSGRRQKSRTSTIRKLKEDSVPSNEDLPGNQGLIMGR
ncbi:MAG: MCE family protein [Candidatus Aureabacteria bacterium]|nr:MCE family protein [Candidatus Auribacterota bacterium]MCK5161724.1 MCE family protein [Candidatus Auribacterota bacterium]MCK5655168.1 MCE family protein [Candidatus Auribacterota bacterium]